MIVVGARPAGEQVRLLEGHQSGWPRPYRSLTTSLRLDRQIQPLTVLHSDRTTRSSRRATDLTIGRER